MLVSVTKVKLGQHPPREWAMPGVVGDSSLGRLPPIGCSDTLRAMGRQRSRALVIGLSVAILAIAATAVIVRSDLRCAGFAGPGVTADELPSTCRRDKLRVATWNLRDFPFDERAGDRSIGFVQQTNICDLEAIVEGLDASVLGLSEIRDAKRFPPVLRRAAGARHYQMALSGHGGANNQRVAIAWDDRELEAVGGPVEIREVTLGQGLRPALAVRLRSRVEPYPELTVVQVHLDSGPDDSKTRIAQHRALIGWVRRETEAQCAEGLIVMGDFNTTGGSDRSVERELVQIDRLYSGVGLRRLGNVDGCTGYWEGEGEPDGLQVPSLPDLVWVRGLGGDLPAARSWLHCRRHGCEPFESRVGNEDGTFWDVSDHCPVTADLPWPPTVD